MFVYVLVKKVPAEKYALFSLTCSGLKSSLESLTFVAISLKEGKLWIQNCGEGDMRPFHQLSQELSW